MEEEMKIYGVVARGLRHQMAVAAMDGQVVVQVVHQSRNQEVANQARHHHRQVAVVVVVTMFGKEVVGGRQQLVISHLYQRHKKNKQCNLVKSLLLK